MNRDTVKCYYQLCKPGILRMVMITAAFGYVIAGNGVDSWFRFVLSILCIGLASGGAAVLNNFLERDVDGLMGRTRNRELPRGKVDAERALIFGVVLTMLSTGVLVVADMLLTAFLVLLTSFLYVLVYTPLKRKTWLNTSIGAIPGGLPIACGCTAATNSFGAEAWLLFAIMYCWQHPHFYAIAWMYRDDYEKAGFKMLSVVDKNGDRLFIQVILYSLLLLAISVLPVGFGMAGPIYLVGAVVLGFYFTYAGVRFVMAHTQASARNLLKASIIYLPALFAVGILDLAL